MKAEVVRLEAYPCYLAVLAGRGDIAKALDKINVRYTEDEKETEFVMDNKITAFVVELEKNYQPTASQRLLGWRSSHIILIWLPWQPRTNRQLATVAHECIHLKNLILRYIGQKRISLVDDEIEANVYDFIFEKVLDACRRRK